MPLVAMTRDMGSLGSSIAQEVAQRQGYRFLRDDILRSAAREYRVHESRLVGVVEEAPGLLERLRPPRFRYRTYLESVVLEIAPSWRGGGRRCSSGGSLTRCGCASARPRRCGSVG
jgi:hypothetical protein